MNAKRHFLLLATLLFLSQIGWAQSYSVGHTTITFNDPTRSGGFGSGGGSGRQIQSEIYYPAASAGENVAFSQGDFPIVVFGHGFVMTWSAYKNIWTTLVAEGYIVVFPRTEGGFSPSHEQFGKDLALCVTKMQALDTDANSLFNGHIGSTSAIIGHSMGGGSAFIAGANNANITTLIGLAPAETNPSAIAAAADVSVPTLVLSGSKDAVTRPAEHHLPIYDATGSSCKYFVSITGGAHCYFANSNFNCDFGERFSFGGVSISRTAQQVILDDYLTKWLDYQLKGEATQYAAFTDLLATDSRTTFQDGCGGVSARVSKVTVGTEYSEVVAYPNPMHDRVTIALPQAAIETAVVVYNQLGQVILSENYSDTQQIALELGNIEAGVYLIKVSYDTETQLLKMIKK